MTARRRDPGRSPPVRAAMRRQVVAVAPDASLFTAARRMRTHGVGCLPVLDGRELIGMVTDRDLVVRGLAEAMDASHLCVRDVMSAGAVSCFPDQSVDDVRRLMTETGITRLPVISRRGRLVGLLSLRDVAGHVARPRPQQVVFYKKLTNSAGRPHAVEVRKVHLSPGVRRDEAGPAAISRFERDHGARPWHLLADDYEVAEGV